MKLSTETKYLYSTTSHLWLSASEGVEERSSGRTGGGWRAVWMQHSELAVAFWWCLTTLCILDQSRPSQVSTDSTIPTSYSETRHVSEEINMNKMRKRSNLFSVWRNLCSCETDLIRNVSLFIIWQHCNICLLFSH